MPGLGHASSIPRASSGRGGTDPQVTNDVILRRNRCALIGKKLKPSSDGPWHVGKKFPCRAVSLTYQHLDAAVFTDTKRVNAIAGARGEHVGFGRDRMLCA